MTEEHKRLEAANELLLAIAVRGRNFFSVMREGRRIISYLELDRRGRVWFVDKWTGKRVYTHYPGRWKHFSEGGTLRGLVIALREFIKRGTPVRRILGPWPADYCGGDMWGYGDSMGPIRERARELRISEAK